MIETMPLQMEYNTERVLMSIPEYGRHVHKLIAHCKIIEDKEERNRMAKAIIDVMGNLQPHLRDVADFKHKLWDQLFFMADFDLDVDSPYPIPTTETIKGKPKSLAYPKLASKYKYYGNNIQTMIDTATKWEQGELREKLTISIANHMKKCYLLWNKDTVSDDIINKHLMELSGNQLSIDFENQPLTDSQILVKTQDTIQGKPKSKKKK
jgi:hypothetical protein